ncbi:MAG: caspase family protein [Phaeodactylibacter sp.]|nr:caspase family protein [Phaeodactylibacter sp.]MCB9048300.1 caspase family protein [Lewinellaceae bacterium]
MANPHKGINLSDEAGSAPSGKNHLLVIAIDTYAHCPKLNNCVKDAQDFAAVMLDKYRFEAENVTTLYNAKATRANILDGLKALKKRVGLEDNLILYFSGHGEVEDSIGYWVPVEARPANEWEFVSTSEIKARLDAINSFHTFVIVDACFSGSLFATYKSVRPGYEYKRSRWGLAASHTRERALDGQPGENSPFAEKLLKLLNDNAEDIGVQKLATEVIEAVQAATRGRQVPVFKPLDVKGDDSGQYVFHLRQKAPAWQSAWAAIEVLPENDIAGLNAKILRLDAYAQQFPAAENIAQALKLGEKLEQKREFFQARNSLFLLRQFAHKKTPFRQQALERIEELKKSYTTPVEPEPIVPPQEKEHPKPPQPEPEPQPQPASFTDPRDGKTYRTVEINGMRWIAENLNYDVGEGCWFYDNDPKNGEKYGRLYTWEAAQKACPSGWRLPTDEEWKALVSCFGGYVDGGNVFSTLKGVFIDRKPKESSYKALIVDGNSGFDALLGGYRGPDGGYDGLGRNGYYWSGTEEDTQYAWLYYFSSFPGKLYRYASDKSYGRSCRCIQELAI